MKPDRGSEASGKQTVRGPELVRYTLICMALALGYLGLSRFGALAPYNQDEVSMLWAPAGMSVAALYLLGLGYWPGIYLGALVSAWMLGIPLGVSGWIAAGGCVAPSLAAWLLKRSKYFDASFCKHSAIFYLAGVAGLGCMLVSSFNGTLAFYLNGEVPADDLIATWFTYWVGDTAGVLLVAPIILTGASGGLARFRRHYNTSHLALYFAGLLICTWIAFSNPLQLQVPPDLAFLAVPLLLFIAYQRGSFVTSIAVALVGAVSVSYTALGNGPFEHADNLSGLISLWGFLFCISISSFIFVAMRETHDSISARLMRNESILSAMCRMTHVGGWELDLKSGTVFWTDEVFRIYGQEIGGAPLLSDALNAYDPSDQIVLKEAIQRAIDTGEGYDLTLGLTTKSGDHRQVRSICRPQIVNGKTAKLSGAFQDITQQLLREQTLIENESKYRILAENVSDIIWTMDLDLNFTYISPSVFRVRGYTPEESIARGASTTAAPGHYARIRAEASALIEKATLLGGNDTASTMMEVELYRKDGSTFPAEISVTAIRDPKTGQPVGLLGVTRDTTEREKARRAILKNKEHLKRTARIARVGGWEYDLLCNTIWWSDETHRLFERPSDYPIPQLNDSLKYIHDEDRSKVEDAIERAIERGESSDLEFRATAHTGKVLWLRGLCEPTIEHGQTTKLVGTIQDITERKNAESRLRLLESVVTCTSDAVIVTEIDPMDEPGPRIVFVNEAFTRMTGYSVEEVLGRSPRFLQGPGTDRIVLDRLKGAMREFEPITVELINYKKNGAPFWVEFNVSPVQNELGQYTYFIAIERDVSDRKKAENEKQELGARAAAVIENAVDGIITIDERGSIESANPAALKLFGYEITELSGQNIKILMPEPYYSAHDNYLRNYLRTGKTNVIGGSREVRGRRKDGTDFPLKLSVGEISIQGKRLFTGITHDLTHEAELEERLRQSKKMESLGTMASGIAHDFNNILQAIIGFSNLAQRSIDGGEYSRIGDFIKEIDRGAERAAKLVEQILTFSRESRADHVPVSLGITILEAVNLLRSTIPASVTLELSLAPEPLTVMGDSTQISQIVHNLGGNAIYAMETGGGTLEVATKRVDLVNRVETRTMPLEPGAYAELMVRDTGQGIAPEIMDRILDPFFTTKVKGKGTGLGLSTVHGVVARMGGGIIIESSPGCGTTVRILMPLRQSVLSNSREEDGESEASEDKLTAPTTDRVLVVDDEDSIVELITHILSESGYDVIGFTQPEKALEFFKKDGASIDFAILDYTMPTMTGIVLAGHLHEINPDMKMLLATGMLNQETLDISSSVGIHSVIKKPFRAAQLLSLLNSTGEQPLS